MLKDHPQRYALSNELHARPFPVVEASSAAVYLAVKKVGDSALRERDLDRAHLIALLDRFGAPHPQPDATHWFGELGGFKLKWELHTEFATYTMFLPRLSERPFDDQAFKCFPEDWLAQAPGDRITSALIRIESVENDAEINPHLEEWFVDESLAVSDVLDGAAVIAGDFRIDPGGHMRFGVFVRSQTGPRRIGRIVQRLCEIETYKSMSMLGLSRAREVQTALGKIDTDLSALISDIRGESTDQDASLSKILSISADLEDLRSLASFRFSATSAYQAIVDQRINILREMRFHGRQTFGEFMMRRFDPAMRTVQSVEERLRASAERAIRAGDLLRTRVDVERSAQNQALLESMDRRADLQLRLQRTVEGLSIVAISYYAVNLMLYLFEPSLVQMGMSKMIYGPGITLTVLFAVWMLLRRIRRSVEDWTIPQ